MKQSLVIIVADSAVEQEDTVLMDLGWATRNFAVALSGPDDPAITHRGLRATVGEGFLAAFEARMALLPDIAAAILVDARPDGERMNHFAACLALAGLQVAEPEVG